MSDLDFGERRLGEDDCICAGTGLVCTLKLEDGKTVVDPKTVSICECIVKRIDREEKLEEAMRTELTHGGIADEVSQVATAIGGQPSDLRLLGRRLDTARDAFRGRMEEALGE
jgi:hypothetical protein